MGKKVFYTEITPLPKHVPRQLALDLLHSHEELIKLNPLVTAVESIPVPRDARNDEYWSEWYLIHEVMTWGPGMKKKMSFKGVFHDHAWGLQSHTYAPLGTDLRQKYRIGGNQPGEPPEPRELGVNTPADGLYLREDHEISCAVPLTAGFVKKEMKAATAIMVERLARKAEMLEQGKLHAMFEAGRLKTTKPVGPMTADPADPPLSPGPPAIVHRQSTFQTIEPTSPPPEVGTFGRYSEIPRSEKPLSPMNASFPATQPANVAPPLSPKPVEGYSELPAITQQTLRAELPGDMAHYTSASYTDGYGREAGPYGNSSMPSPPRAGEHMLSETSGGYKITNPDDPTRPILQMNHSLPTSGSFTAAASHSRSIEGVIQPDVDRFAHLSVSQLPDGISVKPHELNRQPNFSSSAHRCPICQDFAGDEAAVNHHYYTSHVS